MTEILTNFITENISAFSYGAVGLLMALESANIPIPSEVTLPFAGFLASQGKANFHLMALAGGLGCLVGSIPSYWIGKRLGRPFLERYGKWFFITPKQIALGDRWMVKYGNSTSFFSRLLPVVRTFISFIAGVWGAPFWPFVFLTFLGSWIWSYILVYVGFKMGENWAFLHPYWQKFDIFIVTLIVGTVLGYGWYHWKEATKDKKPVSNPD
ncbi:MAG: DedA family protein [Patescibacteria group bacterium]|nr:DedA family protein [Patescibacteria group bacterium]